MLFVKMTLFHLNFELNLLHTHKDIQMLQATNEMWGQAKYSLIKYFFKKVLNYKWQEPY